MGKHAAVEQLSLFFTELDKRPRACCSAPAVRGRSSICIDEVTQLQAQRNAGMDQTLRR